MLRFLIPVRDGAGGTADEGRQWQPYTDHLLYSVLMALPWGGLELVAGLEGDRLGPLFEVAEEYMGLRPRQSSSGLAPFSAALNEADEAAKCAALPPSPPPPHFPSGRLFCALRSPTPYSLPINRHPKPIP